MYINIESNVFIGPKCAKQCNASVTIFQFVCCQQNQGETHATEFNDFADRSLRPTNPHMVTHYQDGNGKARVKGGSALKQSQAYPRKFFGNYLG